MGYEWHAVTEEEKQTIRDDAKKLLDEFSSKLGKIKSIEPKLDKKENLRTEGTGSQPDQEFREFMFDNAPLIEDGLIIAETGKWKK